MAVRERRVVGDGDLEGPGGDLRALGAEALGGLGKARGQAARRTAQGRVAHGAEGYRPGSAPRRIVIVTDDEPTPAGVDPPAAPRQDAAAPARPRAGRALSRPPAGATPGVGTTPAVASGGPAPEDRRRRLPAGRRRAVAASLVVGALGAVGFALIGSIDLGLGLIAVAAFIGWAVALAIVWGAGGAWRGGGSRAAVAAAIAGGSILAGLALLWAWSRSEGGVLGPLDYLDQRFGLLAAVDVLVAAARVGAARPLTPAPRLLSPPPARSGRRSPRPPRSRGGARPGVSGSRSSRPNRRSSAGPDAPSSHRRSSAAPSG